MTKVVGGGCLIDFVEAHDDGIGGWGRGLKCTEDMFTLD